GAPDGPYRWADHGGRTGRSWVASSIPGLAVPGYGCHWPNCHCHFPYSARGIVAERTHAIAAAADRAGYPPTTAVSAANIKRDRWGTYGGNWLWLRGRCPACYSPANSISSADQLRDSRPRTIWWCEHCIGLAAPTPDGTADGGRCRAGRGQ